ncbi:hypothetical protein [Serratia sp. (in: enterobacteria)]|uniref:hypothetical protein n=1 Tax=Serratia sp. (in: enterobacteria) TaxID=616 RepID=UPI003988EAB2
MCCRSGLLCRITRLSATISGSILASFAGFIMGFTLAIITVYAYSINQNAKVVKPR